MGSGFSIRGNKCVCIFVFLELESASPSRVAEGPATRHQANFGNCDNYNKFSNCQNAMRNMAAPAPVAVAPTPVFEYTDYHSFSRSHLWKEVAQRDRIDSSLGIQQTEYIEMALRNQFKKDRIQ